MDGSDRIEQRIAALEREVAELKRRTNGEQDNWLDQVFGRMKHIPEEDFRESVRLCKESSNAHPAESWLVDYIAKPARKRFRQFGRHDGLSDCSPTN